MIEVEIEDTGELIRVEPRFLEQVSGKEQIAVDVFKYVYCVSFANKSEPRILRI